MLLCWLRERKSRFHLFWTFNSFFSRALHFDEELKLCHYFPIKCTIYFCRRIFSHGKRISRRLYYLLPTPPAPAPEKRKGFSVLWLILFWSWGVGSTWREMTACVVFSTEVWTASYAGAALPSYKDCCPSAADPNQTISILTGVFTLLPSFK